MKLDDILKGLFGKHHDVERDGDVLAGSAELEGGGAIAVIGAVGGAPLSPEGALQLAKHVLKVVEEGGDTPILVLVDTEGQLMARRAEMLGLNEYLSHLAKCLLLASREGHRTIGLEYGKAAAGAFLATALATDVLVALPGAEPAVMDLPSIARVTKLDLDKLKEMARSTPVFAPGLDHLSQTGAVKAVWDPDKPLAAQLAATLKDASPEDRRDQLGKEREGRPVAADVARRVIAAATT